MNDDLPKQTKFQNGPRNLIVSKPANRSSPDVSLSCFLNGSDHVIIRLFMCLHIFYSGLSVCMSVSSTEGKGVGERRLHPIHKSANIHIVQLSYTLGYSILILPIALTTHYPAYINND